MSRIWITILPLISMLMGAVEAAVATRVLNLIALDCDSLHGISNFLKILENGRYHEVGEKGYINEATVAFVVHSDNHTETEWKSCKQWNAETQQRFNGIKMKQYQVTPSTDYTVARSKRRVEKVSSIIEVLNEEYEYHHKIQQQQQQQQQLGVQTLIISLAFDKNTIPTAGPMFPFIFDKFDALKADVILPGKNRGFTSVSDWHDFAVIGIRVHEKGSGRQFLQTFRSVYDSHNSRSGRKAFTLIEPRPATRESIVRIAYGDKPWQRQQAKSRSTEKKELEAGFAFFAFSEVCGGDGTQVTSLQPFPCLNAEITYLIVKCTHGEEFRGDREVCEEIDEPPMWRHVDRQMPASWAERVKKPPEVLKNNPIVGMWMGVDRFRPRKSNKEDPKRPRRFCWESGGLYAGRVKKADAWIEYNLTHASPYVHPPEKDLHQISQKSKILILTGSTASASSLDRYMHLQLSKMYYSYRHGYKFVHLMSQPYSAFFHPFHFQNTPENIGARGDNYFRGVMSKVVMLAAAMIDNPGWEWILWTDEDLYLNPGWMHLRLEKYLQEVSEDKLYVAANYRTTFTNIFFIRNTPAGRALVYDWLAVAMSGYVECHGYDQAAVATLHLARTLEIYRQKSNISLQSSDGGVPVGTINNNYSNNRSTSSSSSAAAAPGARVSAFAYQTSKPFGHQCLHCEGEDKCGCNTKGDWSCDFKFEASADRAGYRTKSQPGFFNSIISSFTKGCANAEWPDFHVVTENNNRPRLQCGLCTRLGEIESSGHWDGPLGGGNDKVKPGTINGWLFNHKSQFLFYEAYLDPAACQRVSEKNWIPECKVTSTSSTIGNSAAGARYQAAALSRGGMHDSSSKFEKQKNREHVVSLADGYGYDVEEATFCRITDSSLLNKQRTTTYMKDYDSLLESLGEFSDEEWDRMYSHWDGGEGRTPCGYVLKEKTSDEKEFNRCAPWGAHSVDNMMLRRPQRHMLGHYAPELLGPASSTSSSSPSMGTNQGSASPIRNSAKSEVASDKDKMRGAADEEAMVKKFRQMSVDLNKRLFETPDLCSPSHCQRKEMDWTPFVKPDDVDSCSSSSSSTSSGTTSGGSGGCGGGEVDMSYRNMSRPMQAQVAVSVDDVVQVRGTVMQCME